MGQSKRTKSSCDSSTAAEVYSLHATLREVLWLRMFLKEMEIETPITTMFEDNQPCVNLTALPSGFAGKSKHLEIKFFKVKDYVDSGDIQIQHVNTEHMLADVLTKTLSGDKFASMSSKIMNSSMWIPPAPTKHVSFVPETIENDYMIPASIAA